jgi:hypothetical protein
MNAQKILSPDYSEFLKKENNKLSLKSDTWGWGVAQQ